MDNDLVENLLESAFAEKPKKRSRSPRDSYKRGQSDDKYSKYSRDTSPSHSSRDRQYARDRDPEKNRSYRNYGLTPSSSKYSPPPKNDDSSGKNRIQRSPKRNRSRSGSRERRRQRSRSRDRDRDRDSRRNHARDDKPGAAPPVRDLPPRVKALHDSSDDPEFAQLLSQEDKDTRTVFCMQLSPDINQRDLKDFFRHCGNIVDIRIIGERSRHKSRSSKGVAYIEFDDINAISKAVVLSGRKLLGVPIVVQQSQAEKNRIYCNTSQTFHGGFQQGPMKIMVSGLHPEINQEMLSKIFKPYGGLDHVELMKDVSGESKGYGFVYFNEKVSGEKAIKQLDGFMLVGKKLKVSLMSDTQTLGTPSLDNEEMDRRGIELGPTGRISLMAKLAKSCGMDIPESAKQILGGAAGAAGGHDHDLKSGFPARVQNAPGAINAGILAPRAPGAGVIPSQCFVLSNMFGPDLVMSMEVIEDITQEVLLALEPYGGAVHVHVDKHSTQGNVYVKSISIAQGEAAVNALHKRHFSGREIEAGFIQFNNYHNVFPQSVNVTQTLKLKKEDAPASSTPPPPPPSKSRSSRGDSSSPVDSKRMKQEPTNKKDESRVKEDRWAANGSKEEA